LPAKQLSHDITVSHKEVHRIRRKAEYTAGAAKVLAESMIDMNFYVFFFQILNGNRIVIPFHIE